MMTPGVSAAGSEQAVKDVSLSWRQPVAAGPNLSVPVVLLLMVSTVMMAVLTFVAARSLDRSAEASAQQVAESLLLQSRRDLAKVARDAAQSDSVRAFVQGSLDAEWAERHIGDQLVQIFGTSSSWIIDGRGRTLFGHLGQSITDADAFEAMPEGLETLLERARATPVGLPTSVHGLLLLNGGVHVAAAAAVPPPRSEPPSTAPHERPVLLVTTALDQGYLDLLQSVYFMSAIEVAGEASAETGPAIRLQDPDGETLGWLVLRISAPGTVLLEQVWPAVASAFASMLLLAGLFVRRVERARLQRVRLEETLDRERDLRQMKARFVNMVSHEIRTPLTTIRAATDLLARYYQQLSPAEREDELKAIQREVGVMAALVDDVLTIGRTEGDDFKLQRRPLDLQALTAEIWAELDRAHGRRHELKLAAEPATRQVSLDPTLLRPILTNLLANAIKFSPEGTPVEVDLKINGERVDIRVTDHGIGIPAEQREAVFAPFNRASNVGAVSGTGLGLTIAKQSVERHGGTLQLESQEGKGTEVLVRLPLAA